MKLQAVVASLVAGGLLAADKAPDAIQAALAADRKAKDSYRAKDESEAAEDECAEAMDTKAGAMDAAEEESDKGKEEQAAKDRKAARDARKAARDARKGARDARKAARDKRAKDEPTDPEGTNDNEMPSGTETGTPAKGGKSESGALDSAEVDKRIAAAVAARDALHTARTEVEPILGKVTMDSAEAVYRAALDKLGVDNKEIPAAALPAMLKLARDKAVATNPATSVTMDADTRAEVTKLIPNYNRLRG